MSNLAAMLFPMLLTASLSPVSAQELDRYSACSFYPQGAGCEQIYRQALKDTNPWALPVREAFQKYARYLKMPSAGLTPEDHRWLKDNEIRLPALAPQDLAGLHNLLHDETLNEGDTKRAAVNNFIGRAVQAELYCRLNNCEAPAPGV